MNVSDSASNDVSKDLLLFVVLTSYTNLCILRNTARVEVFAQA